MLEKAQARALPVLNRTVDLTPAAGVCCGVCRTCATTNIFTALGAAAVGAWAFVARRRRGPLDGFHELSDATQNLPPDDSPRGLPKRSITA
jgi:LPXTG-motif cell wall-anchored protein